MKKNRRKKLTTNACYTGVLLLFVGAIGCGSAIEMSTNGLAMLGWSIVAVALLGVSLVLAAAGVIIEYPASKATKKNGRKVHAELKNTVQPKRQNRRGA